MEQGYFDEIDTQENKDVLLNNPPKVDKQLENLYRALKHLQVYCIKINTTPNLNWQDFMKLYRKGLDAKLDDKVEYILLNQNLQLVLREYAAEYLDKLNPNINRVFDELLDFSTNFVEFYPELNRSIEETLKGSKDKDYELVIKELMDDINTNKEKNNQRLCDLTKFSESFTNILSDLGLLRDYASDALKDKAHEIKLLEDELKKLEDKLEKNNGEAIDNSLRTKVPINFKIAKNKHKREKEKEKEKHKQELRDKLAKLQAALSDYDQDYATLRTLYDAACRFAKGFTSVQKDINEVSQGWYYLEVYLISVKDNLTDENIKNNWVRDSLLPSLKALNAKFITLQEEIKNLKKLLPLDIAYGEENEEGEFVEKDKVRITNSAFLMLYINKFLK